MDVITRYLNNISYKFPKGYPDMNDSKDKAMLFELIEQQLNLFSDDVMDQLKVDLKIDDDDFDTAGELKKILDTADDRIKKKYKLDDPKMFEKIVNGIMNARLTPDVLNLLKDKGYSPKILDRYANEISSIFSSIDDKDRDRFINYITGTNQVKFAQSKDGNLYDDIAKTKIDFKDDKVINDLIRYTAQDEKKLGVGMGELALALLFDNISAAQGKGDIALNGEEFEIKGYNAKLERDPASFKATKEDLAKLGITRVDTKKEKGRGFDTTMMVGDEKFMLRNLPEVLSSLYQKSNDKEKFVKDFKEMLANGPKLPMNAINARVDKIDWSDPDSIDKNVGLINFIRYAEKEGFSHFLVHDMGGDSTGNGNYVYVKGSPEKMADELFNSDAYFQRIGINLLTPRIRLK
tara:strand:- start:1 stop:1218 length:1218 start_codon:yes stop_codon:yes gene_type:complete